MVFLLNIPAINPFWATFALLLQACILNNRVITYLVFFNKFHKFYDSNSF